MSRTSSPVLGSPGGTCRVHERPLHGTRSNQGPEVRPSWRQRVMDFSTGKRPIKDCIHLTGKPITRGRRLGGRHGMNASWPHPTALRPRALLHTPVVRSRQVQLQRRLGGTSCVAWDGTIAIPAAREAGKWAIRVPRRRHLACPRSTTCCRRETSPSQ